MTVNTNHKEIKIVEKATDLFMRCGFKSVTMDDVARGLSISKKTLYKFFDNKLNLILRCVAFTMAEEKAFVLEQSDKSKDAIEEMLGIAGHVNQTLKKIHPSAIYDLQKYYPEAWQILEQYTHEFIFQHIKENLEKGMKTGIYRNDIHPDIIAKLFIGKSQLILNNDLFPFAEYKTSDLHEAHVIYHIHGVASAKGLKVLEKHVGNDE